MMKKFIAFILFLLLANLAFSGDRGVVIIAELEKGEVSYEVDGTKSDLDGMIDILRARAKKVNVTAQKDAAIVLADKGLTFYQVDALCSALSAYGFLDIRVLLFSTDMRNLQELIFSKRPIRFTKDAAEIMKIAQ